MTEATATTSTVKFARELSVGDVIERDGVEMEVFSGAIKLEDGQILFTYRVLPWSDKYEAVLHPARRLVVRPFYTGA